MNGMMREGSRRSREVGGDSSYPIFVGKFDCTHLSAQRTHHFFVDEDCTEIDDLFFGHPDWASLVEKALKDELSELKQLSQTRYLIGVLLGEVGNGGTDQWFDSCGHFAIETVEALRLIRADKTADKLAELGAMFPGSRPSKDEEVRSEQLTQLLDTSEAFRVGVEDFDKWLMGEMVSGDDFVFGDDDVIDLFAQYEVRAQAFAGN